MSEIRAGGSLVGTLSGGVYLIGSLSVGFGSCKYEGSYTIEPQAFTEQVLLTTNKTLTEDIKVLKIPYFETSNNSNGTTVYIAERV